MRMPITDGMTLACRLGMTYDAWEPQAGERTDMAKRQTRRSISVKGITYQRLKDYCEACGLSVSGYLEEIIAEKLDAAGVPVPTVVKQRPQPKLPANPDEIVSQHFTF